ncbi:MAG TPA: TetR/AcrR family transcriptional regulator [Ktedonobacterales bacterium]|nr:TetR/AcrR family transcriptional regulator [Ktedonobacterales bacterium]
MARRPAQPGVDRRQQILEAALDVFAEQGFEGATTKEIATRADVTTGLIYFYFPGKEELFFAAFQHQAGQVFDKLSAVFEDAACEQPPELVIRRVLGRFVEQMSSPRSLSLIRIMMRTVAQGEEPLKRHRPLEEARCHIREQAQRTGLMFRQYLDEQIARGTLRPVNTTLAAQITFNGAMLTFVRWHEGDPNLAALSREEMIDALVDICLHGLLLPSATPGQARARGTPPPRRRQLESATRT